jgi:hypothetical protein
MPIASLDAGSTARLRKGRGLPGSCGIIVMSTNSAMSTKFCHVDHFNTKKKEKV